MLERLRVRNFKSLSDISVDLPRLAVLFGLNASGKSNLIEATQALSVMVNARTHVDSLAPPFPVRGYSFEAFALESGSGFPAFSKQGSKAGFSTEADIRTGENERYRYRVSPELDIGSGQVAIADEYLAQLGARGEIKGKPCIERAGEKVRIRRAGKLARPWRESVGPDCPVLSDRSLSGDDYRGIEAVRSELASWRIYSLEPRMAMRNEESPADVVDIGVHGQHLTAFLYKLRAQHPKRFDAVVRTLRAIVPSVESLAVALDEHRGTLVLSVQLAGAAHSLRVLSEGTLRVLALCAIAVNPWNGSLIALEEPENSVHPRRLELIVELLRSLVEQGERQVIVTTYSPLFVDAVLKAKRALNRSLDVGLFNVRKEQTGTVVEPFDDALLLERSEIRDALSAPSEDGLFRSLLLRGFIDE